MIDEELYQKATDELNSEHRRPHIWARACALANDDHDEARYLYTNLRVEELLRQSEEVERVEETGAPLADDLSLEPIEFDDLPPVGDGTVASVAAGQTNVSAPLPGALDEGTMRPVSVLTSTTLELDKDATLDLDPDDVHRLDEAEGEPASSIDGRRASDEVASDEPDALDASAAPADLDAVVADADDDPEAPEDTVAIAGPGAVDERDGLDELFDGVEAARDRPDDRPVSALVATEADADRHATGHDGHDPADDSVVETIEADEIGIDDTIALDPDGRAATDAPERGLDDLDWLDEAYRTERQNLAPSSGERPDLEESSEALIRELRRQDEERHGPDRDDVIPHEPLDTLPTRRVGRDGDGDDDGGDADGREASASHAADGYADPDGERGFELASDQPLELSDGRAGDGEYAVFASPTPGRQPQTVRQGGSWGALVATLPWLLYRHLFGTAIVYALFAAAVLVGLAVTGLSWYEDGDAATFATKSATIGFALLALAGLLFVPFRQANHWREDKLERRGYELVAYVRATRPERAIELVREASDRLG